MVAICLLLAGCACLYQALVVVAAWRFRTTPEPPADFTPPVSVFKPLRGLERGCYELLAGFCRQDYPVYEVLFGVADPNDPVVPIVHRLQEDFPSLPIRLLVADRHYGANKKIDSLDKMYREMRFEYLAVSDSDMRVGADYLRRIMAHFRDPANKKEVGLVTCLYRADHGGTLASVFEAIGIAGEFIPSTMVARMLQGVRFALGSTMAARKELVEAIGGFPAMANASDDYEMGSRVAALGKRVVISPYVADTVLPPDTWRTMIQRQFRWTCVVHASRPKGHTGLIVTYGLPFLLLALVLAPRSVAVWGALLAWLALRLGSAWLANRWLLRDRVLNKYLFLAPARDLLSFAMWLASFFYRRATWRGDRIRLENGRMRGG
jgi:ceramide glucosyltransferase